MTDTIQKTVGLILEVTSVGDAVIGKVTNNIKKYDDAIKKSTSSAKPNKEALKQTKDGLDSVGKAAAGATDKLTKANNTTKKITDDLDKLGKKSKKVKDDISSVSSALGKYTTALALVGGAILTIGAPEIKSAQFERAMSEVKAISGATSDEFVQLSAQARKMGNDTEFSAVQAAGGLKYLVMAGLDAKEAVEALPGVLNLAQAGGMELANAADIATNILTGFGLKVSELGRVNDVLTQTFTNTNSTLQELGYGMAYVAPIASGLGENFEDLAGAMGLLHSAGIKGSMAGTTLRGVMTRLVSPTKDAAKVMESLSSRLKSGRLEIYNAEGNFIGFVELLKQLEEAGATTTEIVDMLGERAGPGLAALLSQGSKALQTMVDLNKQSAGRAEQVARIMHDNVVGSWKAFLSKMEEAALTIGMDVLPLIQSLIDLLGNLVTFLTDLAKEFPKTTRVITLFGLAVTAAAAVLVTFSGGITALKIGLPMLIKMIPSLTGILGGLKVAVMSLITTFTTFTGLVSGLVIALEALVVGTLVSRAIDEFYAWRDAAREAAEAQERLEASLKRMKGSYDPTMHVVPLRDATTATFDDLYAKTKQYREKSLQAFADLQLKQIALEKEKNSTFAVFHKQRIAGIEKEVDEAILVYNKAKSMASEYNKLLAKAEAAGGKLSKPVVKNTKLSLEQLEELKKKFQEAIRKGFDFSDIELKIAKLEYDTAAGLMTAEESFEKITKLRLEMIDRQIAGYKKLQQQISSVLGSSSDEYADVSKKLSGLEVDRLGILSKQVTESQKVSKVLESEKEKQRILLQQLKNAEEDNSGLGTIERLEKEFSYEQYISDMRIKDKEKEISDLKAIRGTSTEDIMKAENELLQMQIDNATKLKDHEEEMAGVRYDIMSDLYEKGKVSAEEYVEVIKEAANQGVISTQEAEDAILKATGDVFSNLKKGMSEALRDGKKWNEFWQDMGETVVNNLASGLTSAISDFVSGTKDAKEAFLDFAKSFLIKIGEMIMQQMILNALSSFGGFSGGGSVGGYSSGGYVGGYAEGGLISRFAKKVKPVQLSALADGGEVPGYSPTSTSDNILAWLTAKEFVHPVDAVKYYGAGVMEALRHKLIPRELFAGYRGVSSINHNAGKIAYATGGVVTKNSGAITNTVSVPVSITDAGYNVDVLRKLLPREIERTVLKVIKNTI